MLALRALRRIVLGLTLRLILVVLLFNVVFITEATLEEGPVVVAGDRRVARIRAGRASDLTATGSETAVTRLRR